MNGMKDVNWYKSNNSHTHQKALVNANQNSKKLTPPRIELGTFCVPIYCEANALTSTPRCHCMNLAMLTRCRFLLSTFKGVL